jgi:hypothetical protein
MYITPGKAPATSSASGSTNHTPDVSATSGDSAFSPDHLYCIGSCHVSFQNRHTNAFIIAAMQKDYAVLRSCRSKSQAPLQLHFNSLMLPGFVEAERLDWGNMTGVIDLRTAQAVFMQTAKRFYGGFVMQAAAALRSPLALFSLLSP